MGGRARKQTKPIQEKKQDTLQFTEEYKGKILKIWKLLQDATPEQQKAIIAKMDEKTILDMRRLANPYKKPVYAGDANQWLVFNYTNIRDRYSQRFNMTALIGFIYRMLDEYKPDDANNYISENDPKFAEIMNPKVKYLENNGNIIKWENEIKDIDANSVITEDILYSGVITNKFDPLNSLIESISNINIDTMERNRQILILRQKIVRTKLRNIRTKHDCMKDKLKIAKSEIIRLNNLLPEAQKKLDMWLKRYQFDKERLEAMQREYDEKNKPKQLVDNSEFKEVGNDNTKPPDELSDEPTTVPADYNSQTESNKPAEPITVPIEQKYMDEATKIADISQDLVREKAMKSFALTSQEYGHMRQSIQSYTYTIEVHTKYIAENEAPFIELHAEFNRLITIESNINKIYKSIYKNNDAHNTNAPEYEITDDEYKRLIAETKTELNIDTTSEEYSEKIQDIIEVFLNKYLRYNPDIHVRAAYKPNYDDPSRGLLAKTIKEDVASGKYERLILPPDDTFYRIDRYTEENYEQLRQATDDIYSERSDFELGIAPLHVITATSQNDCDTQFEKFKQTYVDEFDADPYLVKMGSWTVLGPFEKNRKQTEFYSKHTEVLKRILDQHKDDQRMGAHITADRAKKSKGETDKQTEAHLREFNETQNTHSKLRNYGGKTGAELNVQEFIPRDDRESDAKNEIEIEVHSIAPKQIGRRYVGRARRWHFNAPAEAPKSANVKTAGQFQKELIESGKHME